LLLSECFYCCKCIFRYGLSPENSGYNPLGSSVGPRAGLDVVAKIQNTCTFPGENRAPGRPARSLVTTLTELLHEQRFYPM